MHPARLLRHSNSTLPAIVDIINYLDTSRSIFFAAPWAITGVLNRKGIANHTGPESCVAAESPVQGIAQRFDVVLGILSPIAHYPNKTS